MNVFLYLFFFSVLLFYVFSSWIESFFLLFLPRNIKEKLLVFLLHKPNSTQIIKFRAIPQKNRYNLYKKGNYNEYTRWEEKWEHVLFMVGGKKNKRMKRKKMFIICFPLSNIKQNVFWNCRNCILRGETRQTKMTHIIFMQKKKKIKKFLINLFVR